MVSRHQWDKHLAVRRQRAQADVQPGHLAAVLRHHKNGRGPQGRSGQQIVPHIVITGRVVALLERTEREAQGPIRRANADEVRLPRPRQGERILTTCGRSSICNLAVRGVNHAIATRPAQHHPYMGLQRLVILPDAVTVRIRPHDAHNPKLALLCSNRLARQQGQRNQGQKGNYT